MLLPLNIIVYSISVDDPTPVAVKTNDPLSPGTITLSLDSTLGVPVIVSYKSILVNVSLLCNTSNVNAPVLPVIVPFTTLI